MKTAVYEDAITLTGLSEEETEKIKDDLTYSNPAYETTVKYSKYNYTNVSPYLFYFTEKEGSLTVPIGYDLSALNIDAVEEKRVYPHAEYPPFVLPLRDSQAEAVRSYFNSLNFSTPKGSFQLPTGKGKSILGLYIAHELSCPTLIVVHKNDLVTGWKKDIALAFHHQVKPGLIKASNREIGEQITIATIQTLNRLTEEELEDLYSHFGLVIQDEMHHCPASSFGIVSKFKARYKIGLTATPERADGLAHVMKLYFGDFAYVFTHVEDDLDILNAKVLVRSHPIYFEPVCKLMGGHKYTLLKDGVYPKNTVLPEGAKRVSSLPHAMRPTVPYHLVDDFAVRAIIAYVCEDILNEWRLGHSCVVFFTQKEHCRLYFEFLTQAMFIPVEDIGLYYGDNKDNEAVLEKAEEKRKFITLTTYAKATEGTNVKQWEVVFLVSSVNNGKNVEQAVGRIRRRKEGQKIDPVLIYDYRTPNVYMLTNHGRNRDMRYARLRFLTEKQTPRGAFTRGFRK